MEKTIELGYPWFLKENEEVLMKRLHNIIHGNADQGKGPFKKDTGYAWQLDSTNNWWAEIKDGKLIIGSRYGGKKLETLIDFCKVWFS